MPKEVLIYGPIDYYSCTEFFEKIAEIESEDPEAEIVFRVNTGGGDPDYGWAKIAKIKELTNKRVKVDAKAHSMGLFILCYFDEVECLDVSQFILHRAAYPRWIESSDDFVNDVRRENLINVNAKLEKALRAKIDVAKFEKMKGIKLEDIFSMDGRLEVNLSANEAKQIGLVTTIKKITPRIAAEIESYVNVAANKFESIKIAAEKITEPPKPDKTMTLEELKAKHPEVYAQASKEGFDNGVKAEKNRVRAWAAVMEADPKAAKEGIEKGEEMTMADIAEFSMKAAKKTQLGAIAEDAAGATATGATETLTEEQKKAKAKADAEKAFLADVDKNLETIKA